MIPMHDQDVPSNLIDPPQNAARDNIDPAQLADLADDLAANGLLQRIGLRGPGPDGRYEIVWGHRRFCAAGMLRWAIMPARVAPWDTDPRAMRAAENLVRADLNPREEARSVQDLLDAGFPLPHVARIMRRSTDWCTQRLAILAYPPDLQDAAASGTLPLGVIRTLAQIDHDDYRASLIQEAARTGITTATANLWLAHYLADKDRIAANHETVQQIVGRRELWRLLFRCECCGREEDTRNSALLRVCPDCLDALHAEQREMLARADGNA